MIRDTGGVITITGPGSYLVTDLTNKQGTVDISDPAQGGCGFAVAGATPPPCWLYASANWGLVAGILGASYWLSYTGAMLYVNAASNAKTGFLLWAYSGIG